jgi:hypothetical protein
MSYLSEATSKTGYGVVKIGNYIIVDDEGVISSPEILPGPGVSVDYTDDFITISATGADLINVYGTTTSYEATKDDEYIGVWSASAITITLPTAVDGRVYTIKDEYGQGSGKITIQPKPGTLIDNKNNYVIGVPYQSVNVVFRSGKWWII